MKCRSRFQFAIIAVVFCILAYSTREHTLPYFAIWLDVGVKPKQADYVMILPGDHDRRPFVAAAIVNVGLAKKVVIPKTGIHEEIYDGLLLPEHELYRLVLIHRGVPDGDILFLDGESTSTATDVEALGTFLSDKPNATVLIVTNNYHTRRACWILERILGEHKQNTTFVSAPTEQFQVDNWWKTEYGISAIVGEYLKLIFYALRYGQLAHWITGLIVLALLLFAIHLVRSKNRKFRLRDQQTTGEDQQ